MNRRAMRAALWEKMVTEAEATHQAIVDDQRRATQASATRIARRAEALVLLARTIVLIGKAQS